MNCLIFVGLFALGWSETTHYNCPKKKSTAEFTVEDGHDVMFHTQAGNKYTKKVKCEIEISLGETCEEMELTCDSFNLAKGSILSVKVGDGKAKKFKKKKFKDVTADADTTVIFQSKKKVSTGADCTMTCTVPVSSETTTEGVFIAGGLSITIGDDNGYPTGYGPSEGFYDPGSNTACEIPSLPVMRIAGTTTGYKVCGGVAINVINASMYTTYSPIDYAANYCEEFDPSSGSWIISNVWENPPRIYHVAWQSSEGLYLIGGLREELSTTLLLDDGSSTAGFQLVQKSLLYKFHNI